ncbi:hypothetical protein SSX86_020355 [Deinandra increscens subsp. villosa]|uniref:Uncharacterized protein n=1 Tax=Deinandra increscens subsp. villosa TaxID=3103831 RepID=A0AAP0CMT2_9ASTR
MTCCIIEPERKSTRIAGQFKSKYTNTPETADVVYESDKEQPLTNLAGKKLKVVYNKENDVNLKSKKELSEMEKDKQKGKEDEDKGKKKQSKGRMKEQIHDPVADDGSQENETSEHDSEDMDDASDNSNIDGSSDDEGGKISSPLPVSTEEESEDNAEGYMIVTRTRGKKKKELAVAVNDNKPEQNEEKEGTPTRQLRLRTKGIVCNDVDSNPIESSQEDYMVEKHRKPKRKRAQAEKGVKGTKTIKEAKKLPSIRIRTAPLQLCKAIGKLSRNQRRAVREMGMGRILKFRMDGIPGRIGYFVVDSFNPEEMHIDLGSVKVKVDEEKITKLFGLKNEGHILDGDSDSPVETAKAWRARYGGANVSRVQVAKKMAEDRNESGTMFKMDFIALFGSVMVEYGNNEKIKLELMSYIRDDMDLDKINWNRFVIDALKRCKAGWDRLDPESRFTGPMALLMVIYVDSIICSGINIDRTISPISFWTQDMLKLREEFEIQNGGFGIGKQRDTYIDKEDDDSDQEGCSGEHLDRLKEVFNLVKETKKEAETALVETYTKFPEVAEVKAYVEVYNSTYKDTIELNKNEHSKGVDNGTIKEVENITEEASKGVKAKKRKSKKVVDNTMPSFDMGIDSSQSSPESVQGTQDKKTSKKKVLEAYKEMVGKSVQDEQMKDVEVKRQVGDANETEKEERIGISPEVEEEYSVEKKVRTDAKEGEEDNTEEEMSEEGMVDINRAANKRERLLWQYLMACQQSKKKVNADKDNDKGENDEMLKTKEGDGENAKRGFMRDLFTTVYGLTAKAFMIGSLMPGKKVDTNIVSCWAAVLNFEEAAVEKGQQRLFLYPDTMNESVISEKSTNPKRVEKFENRLLVVVDGDKSRMDMKSFKTIVVPIKDGDHLYIMCFDLDVPAITVIESVHEGISLEDMADGGKTYASKGTPHKVKHVIWSYLQKVSHPKAMSISATKPRLLKSTWTTKTEYTDSGVYAMRNMESYKGRTSGFDNGFRNDDKQRETQVQNLRMRYACKLLSSAANASGERTMKGSETTNRNLQRVSNDDSNKAAAMQVLKFLKKLDGEYEKIVKGLEDIKGEEPKKEDAAEEKKMLKLKKDVKGKRVRFE